jgi:hypothetical protein
MELMMGSMLGENGAAGQTGKIDTYISVVNVSHTIDAMIARSIAPR